MKWGWSFLSAVFTCSLALSPALADDVEQAKAHFAIGVRAYEDKKFGVAIEAFEEAQRLAPRPANLFTIAQAYRRKYYIDRDTRDLANAVNNYKQYIAADPNGPRVGEAGAALADLEPLAERLGATAAPPPKQVQKNVSRILIAPSIAGAKASIDGGAPIEVPAGIEVPPGAHTVIVSADGYADEQRQLALDPGESFALDIKMTEKPARLSIRGATGVSIYVDGRPSGTTPLPTPINLPAGRHVVSLTQRGALPVSMEVDLGPGQDKILEPEFSASGVRKASYVFMGLGTAGVVAGAVLLGLTFREESEAKDIAVRAGDENITGADAAALDDAVERRDLYRGISLGAFAGGGAVALTGVLLFLLDDPAPDASGLGPSQEPPKPTPSIEVLPSLGWRSGGVTIYGRF